MNIYISITVRIPGNGKLLVMPTRMGFFLAFCSSSSARRPTCLLMVARWLPQLHQESRGSPRSPCWCLIGQMWATRPLLVARGAGVLGAEWTSPASSKRQTRVGGERGVRGRVGSHPSICLPEEMAYSPQPYRGETGAKGREMLAQEAFD